MLGGVSAANGSGATFDTIRIRDQLAQFIASEFGAGEAVSLHPDDDLIKQGIVDSIGVLQIAAFVEETYGARIADDEITVEYFKSISSIARLVEEKVRAAQ